MDEDRDTHFPSCCACMNISMLSKKNLKSKKYDDTNTTSKLPVPRPPDIQPPRPPSPSVLSALSEETSTTETEAAHFQDVKDPNILS